MALYVLRYVHPDSPEWEAHLSAHVAWLLARVEDGSLVASGPLEDAGRREALLIVNADSPEEVERIAATDPYWIEGLVIEHTVERWDPIFGAFNAYSSRAGQIPPPAGEATPAQRVDPYEGGEQVWSGDPNGSLVAEAAGLPPGRAVDIGAGEGADASWLARQGWSVTAVEPSEQALRTARAAADSAGVDWVQAELLDARLPRGAFDLVTCHYPALLRTPGHDAERALTELVAPGGTLLVVTHADVDRERALAHGFDPDDYLDHDAFRAALPDDWTVETDERRDRRVHGGAGAHHHADLVLRARRPRPADHTDTPTTKDA